MDKKTASSGEHGEEKDENFLTKAAHSIRDKLRSKRHRKDKDRKSKSEAAGKTESSSAVSDEDDEDDAGKGARLESKATATKKEPTESSADPSSKNDANSSSSKTPTKANNNDKVHISFHGISTVDDLLDRIDKVVTSAKIVVEGDTSKTTFAILDDASARRPSTANLDKKPLDKSDGDAKANASDEKTRTNAEKNEKKEEGEEGPIRIDYNDIHTIEDLLKKVSKQPGSREVVLENAPDDSESVTVQQSTKTSQPARNEDDGSQATTAASEKEDPSAPPKSILKTSQDPSSLDTSTKVASLKDDQIHVNIEGVQSLDELLDRLDGAVQSAPLVIETKAPAEEKRTAPQELATPVAPSPNRADNPAATSDQATVVKSTTTTTTVTETIRNDTSTVSNDEEKSHTTADNPVTSSATRDEKESNWI